MVDKEALEIIRYCCEESLYLPQNQSIEQVQLVGKCLSSIDDSLNRLDKLESEIQTKIDALQKRQEYLNSCLGDMECYIEYNYNNKRLELLFELKKVLENDR